MRSLALLCLPLAFALAACSPSSPDNGGTEHAPAIAPVASTGSAPADPTLGSAAWYAWVNHSLDIETGADAPKPGSDAWNMAVQQALGPAAPHEKLGSPQWQSAVDAILRTRHAEAQNTHSQL